MALSLEPLVRTSYWNLHRQPFTGTLFLCLKSSSATLTFTGTFRMEAVTQTFKPVPEHFTGIFIGTFQNPSCLKPPQTLKWHRPQAFSSWEKQLKRTIRSVLWRDVWGSSLVAVQASSNEQRSSCKCGLTACYFSTYLALTEV